MKERLEKLELLYPPLLGVHVLESSTRLHFGRFIYLNVSWLIYRHGAFLVQTRIGSRASWFWNLKLGKLPSEEREKCVGGLTSPESQWGDIASINRQKYTNKSMDIDNSHPGDRKTGSKRSADSKFYMMSIHNYMTWPSIAHPQSSRADNVRDSSTTLGNTPRNRRSYYKAFVDLHALSRSSSRRNPISYW